MELTTIEALHFAKFSNPYFLAIGLVKFKGSIAKQVQSSKRKDEQRVEDGERILFL